MSLFALTANASPSAKPKTIVLTSDNTLVLDQEVDDSTVAEVTQQAMIMDSKLESKEPIYLVLATPGGSIQAGLEFIQNMKSLNRPVHTITIFAASMGFQIVEGLGQRYVTQYGTLMAHKARGGFQGEFPGQINSRLTYWLKRLNRIDQDVVSRTNGKLNLKTFQDLYENEVWIEGPDTVEVGLADEVVLTRCDQSLIGTKSAVVNFMGFSFEVIMSKCPTVLGILGINTMIHTDQGIMKMEDFLKKGGKLSPQTDYYSSYKTETVGPNPVSPPTANVTIDIKKIEEEKVKVMEKFQRKRTVYKEKVSKE